MIPAGAAVAGPASPGAERSNLPPPHGGTLIDRRAPRGEARAIERESARLPYVVLDARRRSDLDLIAGGGFSPLRGFMGREEFDAVLHRRRLPSGLPWTIPIVLPAGRRGAGRAEAGGRVALRDTRGILLGVIDACEPYESDPREHARIVYGTDDPRHPGVRRVIEDGPGLLGGPVTVLRPPQPAEFPKYRLDPAGARAAFSGRGWRTVVGFQTRNPIHRAHEFLLKSALEIFDALFIQPLVGETRPGDLPASVRLRCYEALLEGYYPRERTMLGVLPAWMRFAGPREAVFHALVRKNFGCTHFIVGRDHAGVDGFYAPGDAQRIFDDFTPEEIGIVPLRFGSAFYCRACGGMASARTCPHPSDLHLILSGTRVREMLRRGEALPPEFTRPEVAAILRESLAGPAGAM